jgi:hypothetical protein
MQQVAEQQFAVGGERLAATVAWVLLVKDQPYRVLDGVSL